MKKLFGVMVIIIATVTVVQAKDVIDVLTGDGGAIRIIRDTDWVGRDTILTKRITADQRNSEALQKLATQLLRALLRIK